MSIRWKIPPALLLMVGLVQPWCSAASGTNDLPTFDQALAAKQDVWGQAAMRQTNGASYEFFEKLLPPLRYVNAAFRYYPIVLSAPNAPVKARLISNGSGVNLAAGARSWNDVGTPVDFHVGPDEFAFGGLRDRLEEPTLAEGWLPIVEIRYRHPTPTYTDGSIPLDHPIPQSVPEIYRLEAFASTQPELASNGVVFVRFDLAQGTNGFVAVGVGAKAAMKFALGKLSDEGGRILAVFDPTWKWERGLATARLRAGSSATLAIATRPLASEQSLDWNAGAYTAQRERCAKIWRDLLARGMNLTCPESIVNNAWHHLIVQNFELVNGDRVHYSAGNQYDKLYEAEGTDAALGMLAWGYETDMRRWLPPLLDFTRKNLECHQAGFKLEDLCRYFWQTHDTETVRELRPRWEKEARLLADSRTNEFELCPKGQYCGDIHSLVYSLTVNAKGWRALRDLTAVLHEIGENKLASEFSANAARFRSSVLKAVAASVRRETSPPFVPVALYTNEPAHDPITDRRIGCYWNVVIDYVLGSGIFPPGSAEETWIANYQEEHGGLCMGMLRAGAAQSTFWTGYDQIWPLYTTRYALDTLRRDDPERALVSLYGMLAQGFTRNTFICGEGCDLTPVDEGGRFFYCPPNSAANSHFLSLLRCALVQDWDLDDDGKPETLRLFFATPRAWLEDGKAIKLERAPTAFGPVSVRMKSKLAESTVVADIELPQRNQARRVLLRARVPEGYQIVSARAGARALEVDEKGTVDLSPFKGKVQIVFKTRRR
jgi:hypothetical protein